jgi:hypothetical protein
VGQEIVPNKDSGQNEVIDNMLEIVVKQQGWFDVLKSEIEILGHEREVEQVEVDRSRLKRWI